MMSLRTIPLLFELSFRAGWRGSIAVRPAFPPRSLFLSIVMAWSLVFSSCAVTVVTIGTVETLYFGTVKAGGAGAVTEVEWQRFLDNEIAPRFPEGFTTWEAAGQWRTKDGRIERERTHIVQIVGDHAAGEAAFRSIIDSYKKTFGQESVLRVSTRAGILFQ